MDIRSHISLAHLSSEINDLIGRIVGYNLLARLARDGTIRTVTFRGQRWVPRREVPDIVEQVLGLPMPDAARAAYLANSSDHALDGDAFVIPDAATKGQSLSLSISAK